MDKNQKQLTHDEHLELELLRILVSDALESVKAQQIMEIIKRERQSVSLSNVKHCLDWTLDENIMTVANLFVEGKI